MPIKKKSVKAKTVKKDKRPAWAKSIDKAVAKKVRKYTGKKSDRGKRFNLGTMEEVTTPRKKRLQSINTKAEVTTGIVIPKEDTGVEMYMVHDEIIGNIDLPPETEVRVDISASRVRLTVGPRDWEWDRRTRTMIGCGTMLSEPVVVDDQPATTEPTKETV